jgi:hypothetical protein
VGNAVALLVVFMVLVLVLDVLVAVVVDLVVWLVVEVLVALLFCVALSLRFSSWRAAMSSLSFANCSSTFASLKASLSMSPLGSSVVWCGGWL